MACTPLDIQVGYFYNTGNWDNTPSQSFDGKTLTLTTSGPNPGISVQQGPKSVFHAQLSNRTLSYMVLGNKYLVILDMEGGGGASTRWVSLVNFATWTEVPILNVLASSNQVPPPIVNPSPGNGVVFLAYGQDGTQQTSVAIFRSDNGDTLCPLGFTIVPTGQTLAEATATQLIIHYSTGNTNHQQACPRPLGKCQVTPGSQTFPDVHVGGCPFTAPTKQFTIKNIGDDCLTVTSISNNAPFSVQATSHALPYTLAKNETIDVTVAFNPTAVGNWTAAALAVSTTPANGDNQLVCKGQALAAEFKIQFNQTTFNFGKYPVGMQAPDRTLTITNNGSRANVVSVPSLNVSGFSCAGFNGTLNCGQAQDIPLHFTPPSLGPQSAMLSVSSNAPGSPNTITLLGEGCIPHAEIAVPPAAPINFGQVQQGFRTVRLFEVQNTGDALLMFNGSITGPDAALFGLPDPNGSVTDAPGTRPYQALPVSPCGAGMSGSGKVVVAVSFFANHMPKVASATLTLGGHNATNVPASQTWLFPLTGEITPPVALDVGLVVDRSGSMTDSLGSRVKMEAAVAASQLLAELLRPDLDDRAAVVRFNHNPEVIVPMSGVSTTISPTQDQIVHKVQNDIPPADGFTAIAGGAMTGIKEIQKPRATTPPKLTRALVVLTDGEENTGFEDPPGSGNWFSILGGQMSQPAPATGNVDTNPMPRPSDIGIYAIGLGRDSDIDPNQLAALASDPKNFLRVDQDLTGEKYFELEKYYTQIFMDIVGTSSVLDPMFWIAPGDTHEIEYDVLRGDVDALVVVYDFKGLRLPFYCLSPKGELVDPAVIPPGYQLRAGATSQARLVEYKMPLKEPDRYAGRWKVIIKHPGRVCSGMPPRHENKPGFLPRDCKEYKQSILYGIAIGVGSNFRMMPFLTPSPVYVGDPILLTAVVSEAGLPVTGCNVTVKAIAPGGLSWTLQLLDDGAHSDGGADDGEYAWTFTHTYQAGTYHFQFRAVGVSRDGEPVVREAVRDKPVLARMPPAGGQPGDDQCCKELLKAIREQTRMLERALGSQKTT